MQHEMQDYVRDAKVVILSYNLMERGSEIFLKRKFGVVIMVCVKQYIFNWFLINLTSVLQDESHSLKNKDAKSTQAALQIAKAAKRVILLTGTPALSRPYELFTQLQMIDPNFFTSHEYCMYVLQKGITHFH